MSSLCDSSHVLTLQTLFAVTVRRCSGTVIRLSTYCMIKRIFVFRKVVKETQKTFMFLNFHFLISNEHVRKQHLSANTYSCVNMKFSYAIALHEDEILCRILTKTSDFWVVFRSTFRWWYFSSFQQKQAIGQLSAEDI